jgi:hypothetical protein
VLKKTEHRSPMVVDLTESIWLCTAMPQENHAALRSGFAGYPANPRWNVTKYQAWKTGRQLREALKQGEMVVRSTDCMLIPAKELDNNSDEEVRSTRWINFFLPKQLQVA